MTYTESCGNVFEDLSLDEADLKSVKAQIALLVCGILERRSFTQKAAAGFLGTTQSGISKMNTGKVHHFSLHALFDFLNKLGCDVVITISPAQSGERGRIKVVR